MKEIFTLTPARFFLIALLVALPAFFINLGKQPVIDDEAIRALVALDMLEKGDYITPSVAGEIYLKKPPLYNWLIAISFQISGSIDEFALRLPMVLSLLLFTLLIYFYFRKEMDVRIAAMTALFFLTSGRIIFYESLHGLIDITYSMLIFFFFMHVYRSFMQGDLRKLFLVGYLVIALAFLMKGIPSLVFLAFTLLVLFLSNKRPRQLFHWSHFAGVLIFLVIVGGYYLLYFSRNDISPKEMFGVVIGESTRRTAVRFGFWDTAMHLATYPFNILYHFLPWGLMAILLFRKGSLAVVRKQPFMRYLALVFLANIIVYWISPEVYPRYILMLVPLFYGIFSFLYLDQKEKDTLQVRLVEWIFGGILVLASFSGLAVFFADLPITPARLAITGVLLSALLAVTAYKYWKDPINRMFWMALALLVVRIGFDMTVIPARVAGSEETANRLQIQRIAEGTAGSDLRLKWNTDIAPNPYYGYRVTSYRTNYYLCLFRGHTLKLDTAATLEPNTFYISTDYSIDQNKVDVIEQFNIPGQESALVLYRKKQD